MKKALSGMLLTLSFMLSAFSAHANILGLAESVDLKIGQTLPTKANYLSNGFTVKYELPALSSNVVYRGGGWISFMWADQCFLMKTKANENGYSAALGLMTRVDCVKLANIKNAR